ncbi:hypothetical protein Phi87_05 [Enterobacteria phage UAB_Phi87]|uniref:Uncharacterized protein n=1 Tax=Enterobacteria phage UAB_Phi87 TaxID=1197935 RepID=M1FLI3_9CAUD|nr:hypothetical protein Phi87_05 [Enterobacteria phage UAB_Phi87]AFQ96047.1 hypothetical protein Phi87_05 [Enterobacteria phage UAB_Phi87]
MINNVGIFKGFLRESLKINAPLVQLDRATVF